jgi:CRISPR system Cascade subunit CasB
LAQKTLQDFGEEAMITTETESLSQERQFINEVWERIEGDRGAIATLGRCLNQQGYYQRQAAQYVYPYLPDKIREYQVATNRYVFVAALMAANHQQNHNEAEQESSFGVACRVLKRKLGENSGGLDRRFQALLNADGEEVYRYIEMLAPLLRQHQVPCDWAKLLQDLNWWDYEGENVRLRWARDYYKD